ncbi:MAG TPA: hypothetical protein VGC06_31265 [Actinomycetes bacterium]
MLGLIFAFTAGAVTLALLLAWAGRTPGAGELGRWAARYELDLRREDRPWVARELRRGRLLRTLGFTAVFGIGMGANIWWGAVHQVSTAPFPLNLLIHPAAWATGYLVGATVAELTRRGRDRQPVRAAALVPRRLGDYLPGWMLWVERGVALAVLALSPLPHLSPPDDPSGPGHGFMAGVAAIAIAAAVELALRSMVVRRQPVATPAELAVDDAMRSTSIHRTAGAGLAALLFLLGEQAGGLPPRVWLLSSVVGLLCYGLAIGAWKDLTVPLRWRIRRAYGSGGSGQAPLPRHDPGRGPA